MTLSTTSSRVSSVARRMAAVAALALCLSSPAAAGAAAPVVTGPVEVQVWPGEVPGGAVVIISTRLDESVRLPATVRLPLPEGLNVDWAGEIAPSNPASDVAREFTTGRANGGRYVQFEVSKYREAQADLSALPITVQGDASRVTMRYVQSTPSTETGFSVRVPAGYELKDSVPRAVGKPAVNVTGESLHALETQTLKLGEGLDVSVEYRAKAPVTPASRADRLLVALAIAVVVVAAVLAVVVVRGRSAGVRAHQE